MKYIYKLIILLLMYLLSYFLNSPIIIHIIYFGIVILSYIVFKELYDVNKIWAKVYILIIVIAYFIIGYSHRNVYIEFLDIPIVIYAFSQAMILTILPYNRCLGEKYKVLSEETKTDENKLSKIIENNKKIKTLLFITLFVLIFIIFLWINN